MTSAQNHPRKPNGSQALQAAPRTTLIIAGVVLSLALLSFYGHLVLSQVKRGEAFREAQRAGLYVVREGSLLRPAPAPGAQGGPLLASATLR